MAAVTENRILDAEEVRTIREMYTSGDEWDDDGNMVGLCDSHEALRAALATATAARDRWIEYTDAYGLALSNARARVAALEAALRTLIEDYYVEETYPATVKAVRAVLAVPEGDAK